MTILADNTGFFIGNTNGGFAQAFDYAGHGDYCAIADGGNKVYDDAPVTDIPAGGASGEHVTVSVNFCSSTAPSVGDTTDEFGGDLICIDVQQDWKVGEYITGSATYVSYVPE